MAAQKTSSSHPPKYLIIGSGKISQHVQYYFKSQKINFLKWSRKNSSLEELQKLHVQCDLTLMLISDHAIEPFITENSFLKTKPVVHFSGSLFTPLAIGAHPLMTFTNSLYEENLYPQIPFVCDQGASFKKLFPQLSNPAYEIKKEQKALYHALCVASGNFTTLLWQNAFEEFEKNLLLPKQLLIPYLRVIMQNLENQPEQALTGPIARNDSPTLIKNLTALRGHKLQNIFEAFVKTFACPAQKEIL